MREKQEDVPLNTAVFTEKEILELNLRHDRFYGWSYEWKTLYTNYRRFPKTQFGPPFAIISK
jgi:hypothetical protein